MTTVRVQKGSADAIAAAAASKPASAEAATTILAPKAAEVTINGLQITLKEPDAFAQFELVRMIEPAAAMNAAYVMMLAPLLYVGAIDGIPQGRLQSEREAKALVIRLGIGGANQLAMAVHEHFDGDEDRDLVKNS